MPLFESEIDDPEVNEIIETCPAEQFGGTIRVAAVDHEKLLSRAGVVDNRIDIAANAGEAVHLASLRR
jgi:hypothetical protein